MPFVSNLPVKVDVFVEPTLSAVLDGNPLKMSARTKPFQTSNETILDVVLDKFDLTPWLAYAPFEPAFRLPSAQLTTNIEVSFRQPADAAPELVLRGPLRLDQFVRGQGGGSGDGARIRTRVRDVQPLIGRWQLTRMRCPAGLDLRLKEGNNLATLLRLPRRAKPGERRPGRGGQRSGQARG